jgi:hypothetical protein
LLIIPSRLFREASYDIRALATDHHDFNSRMGSAEIAWAFLRIDGGHIAASRRHRLLAAGVSPMTTLWAITRDAASIADLDHIAAPSSEAALAACTGAGDRVQRWQLGRDFHAAEVGSFLQCWEPTGDAS